MFYGTGNHACHIALRMGDKEMCLSPVAWGMEVRGTGDCACHIMHGDGKGDVLTTYGKGWGAGNEPDT